MRAGIPVPEDFDDPYGLSEQEAWTAMSELERDMYRLRIKAAKDAFFSAYMGPLLDIRVIRPPKKEAK